MSLKRKKKRRIFYILVGLILLLSMFLDTFLLLKYNVLPFKYLMAYAILAGLIPILLVLYTVFRKKRTKFKIFCVFLEALYVIALFIAFFYMNKTFNFLNKFTSILDYETKNYYVIALKDSNYNDIKDLNNKKMGYTKGLDESIDKALEELKKNISISASNYDGYGELLENLDNKEIDSVLILNSYYDMLNENDSEDEEVSEEKYKIVHKITIKEKAKEVEKKDVNVTKEPFNVYISGIDTYGNISDKTRSDVNILMSVNPKTHKILLINIPRDYYVEIADEGKKDKLTHAGTRGVNVSAKTIEKLLDVEINYYVKVNYNALINLVDALGGVDVYSEYNFSSYELHHRFKVGYNHVNGKQALDFARTRKAFKGGDRVRGENQQRMIEAIVKKASSASILVKYDDILKALDGSFVTNISTNSIMSLVNMQLDKMPSWKFDTYSLNGSDSMQATDYWQKSPLYVMIPDEETVNEAKQKIQEVFGK
jgi:LCP family protein required for cell wall assembly